MYVSRHLRATWQSGWRGWVHCSIYISWYIWVFCRSVIKSFFFCIYILGYGQKKKQKQNKNGNQKTKHRKIHTTLYCTLQAGNIFLSFVGWLVTSMWHHYIGSAGVWKLYRFWGARLESRPLLSATFNTKKHSDIIQKSPPQSSYGTVTFLGFFMVCNQLSAVPWNGTAPMNAYPSFHTFIQLEKRSRSCKKGLLS